MVGRKSKVESSVESAKDLTLADQIWEKIKDIDLQLWALEGQTLEKNATRVPVDDEKLYLLLKAGAVMPVLEEALRKKKFDKDRTYEVSTVSRYCVINVVKPFPF